MNPDTGEILSIPSEFDPEWVEQVRRQLEGQGFTVPIPEEDLKRVKKMSMAARIRWAQRQKNR